MAQWRFRGERVWGAVFVGAALFGCSSSDDADRASADVVSGDSEEPRNPGPPAGLDGDDSPAEPGASPGGLEGPASESAGSAGVPSSPSSAPPLPAEGYTLPVEPNAAPGTVTAGTWDDSRNLDRFLQYQRTLSSEQMAGLPEFDEDEQRAAAQQAAALEEHATLDVALVIDTTGSMADELSYLQTEFVALAASIEAAYPGSDQRWALVVYRDVGDEYVTRSVDFVTPASFREQLAAQSAGGGGDTPEAPDAALEAMNQLGWRSDASTSRLAFWVADAPHHTERTEAFRAAVGAAAAQDVHLYPIASSGVDELTEYSMRAAAQLTLGRYLFLTDDSGVGGAHKEPTIPCYFVTKLDDAILRMVDIEMSGVYRLPKQDDIIRTGGNPSDGACVLASGQTVMAF